MRAEIDRSPVALALRKAGFVPLPRLWVKKSDMPDIHRIAYQHTDLVNTIRGEVHEAKRLSQAAEDARKEATLADPILDKDAAWAAFERERNG